jgi:hypothetical protein
MDITSLTGREILINRAAAIKDTHPDSGEEQLYCISLPYLMKHRDEFYIGNSVVHIGGVDEGFIEPIPRSSDYMGMKEALEIIMLGHAEIATDIESSYEIYSTREIAFEQSPYLKGANPDDPIDRKLVLAALEIGYRFDPELTELARSSEFTKGFPGVIAMGGLKKQNLFIHQDRVGYMLKEATMQPYREFQPLISKLDATGLLTEDGDIAFEELMNPLRNEDLSCIDIEDVTKENYSHTLMTDVLRKVNLRYKVQASDHAPS